jgi:hypothetical protein
MKREFISLNGLKNVLSPKEMKNVKGGSSGRCIMNGSGTNGYCDGCFNYACTKEWDCIVC